MILIRTKRESSGNWDQTSSWPLFTATIGTDRFVASNEASVFLSHRRYMKTFNRLPVALINLTSSVEQSPS
jgi:hypothetical protein